MKRTADEVTSTYLWDVAQEFLVRCPTCESTALVKPSTTDRLSVARLTCTACGLGKDWCPSKRSVVVYTTNKHAFAEGEVCIGAAVDWYFHLPLWLQTPCCGETLWAYNADHLAWLKAYVGADLRGSTRNAARDCWANAALASRLPRWMKLAKNREAVLRGIEKLEQTLR